MGPASNVAELTVSELSAAIKRTLEDGFGYVRLRGEISGYRGPHASGHAYFALKDDKAKIDAVIWKSNVGRLRFRPEEGMEVIAQGRITTYPGSSKYQIVVETLEPAGVGALMALLEERKRKLAVEGLFDDARKKKLPFLPRVVGIVTSPTGAVIRDMLHGFNERYPTCVLVWPVRVQGDGSAVEVAAAIQGFNRIEPGGKVARPDVLIVARGGGSLEDLWGFNEEIVVRAVAASAIPVISAVGHETDWTLIDLVADARAPTPTKAAEWAVPKYADLVERTEKLGSRNRVAVRRLLEGVRAHLKAARRGLPRADDLVAMPRQRFDAADRRLGRALLANTRAHAMRHARIAARLHPRLLGSRIARTKDRLASLARHAAACLERLAGLRRTRLERLSGRLAPDLVRARLVLSDERLAAVADRAHRALDNRVCENRRGLERLSERLSPELLDERLARARERLQVAAGRAEHTMVMYSREKRRGLDAVAGLLRSLGYQSALRRGYALVRDGSGAAVRSITAVRPGALI
jgi:exodeoxyribonuclease VII large subunit